jgi:hypothetical protein
MNEYQLSKKYIDFTLRNFEADGTLKIINYERDIGQTIVNNMSEYDLSVVRFKLPASAIKKYYVKKGSQDHILYMRWGTFMSSLDLSEDYDIECYSPKVFLDYLNPAIRRLYAKYYLELISGGGPPTFASYTGTFEFENVNDSLITTRTFNSPSPFPGVDAQGSAYIKFTINSITPLFIPEINQYAPSDPLNLHLSLSCDGIETILLNTPNYTSLSDFAGVVLEDGVRSSNQLDFRTGPKNRQPYEPLYKLNNVATSTKPWTLKFMTYDMFSKYDINFTVEIFYILPPELTAGAILIPGVMDPPFISYDSSDNFVINYSPAWFRSGLKLGFSDALHNALDYFDYIPMNDMEYYLALPQQTASTETENTLNTTQLQSSMYKFNMIHSIELLTDLPVENELTITTITDNSSNESIITDFLPDPALPHDNYFYNANTDYRRYRLDGQQLKKLSVKARVVYTNGDKELIKLKKGEVCNIKLELVPTHGLY